MDEQNIDSGENQVDEILWDQGVNPSDIKMPDKRRLMDEMSDIS